MNADKLGPGNWRHWKRFTGSLCSLAMAWGLGHHLYHQSTAGKPLKTPASTPAVAIAANHSSAAEPGPQMRIPAEGSEDGLTRAALRAPSPEAHQAAARIPDDIPSDSVVTSAPSNAASQTTETATASTEPQAELPPEIPPEIESNAQLGRVHLDDRAEQREPATSAGRAQPVSTEVAGSGAGSDAGNTAAVIPPTPHEFYANEPVGRAHVSAEDDTIGRARIISLETAGSAQAADQEVDVAQANNEAAVESKGTAVASQEAAQPAVETATEPGPTAPINDEIPEFKPIGQIGLKITPPVEVDQDGKPRLPPDDFKVTDEFRRRGTIDYRGVMIGSWYDHESLAPDFPFCFRPLRFEDPNLERCGVTRSEFLQPAISAGHFFGSVALLPGKMLLLNGCACVSPFPDCPPCSCYSLKDNFFGLEFDWLPSLP